MDRMRQNHHMSFSESLKATLNCYRLSSMDSLGGPSGCSAVAAQMWFKENKQSPPLPPPLPLVHIPLLMPKDTSSRRSETVLGGEKISCFIVGGEKRLCLPQILTTVLKDFSISEINRACAELHIYCSRCSPDQLEILKVLGVLPFNTTQCGLITKTDAERLMSSLGVENLTEDAQDFLLRRTNGIPVYHECFGRGEGTFYPDLYVTPDAPCISCEDCRMNLSPAKFVSHSHRGLEKRTCHWGFDRDNWRYYIFVPDFLEERKYVEMAQELKKIKEKFPSSSTKSEPNHRRSPVHLKRRIKTEINDVDEGKRIKVAKPEVPGPAASSDPKGFPFVSRPSAFKPWSSGLPSLLPSVPPPNNDALLKILEPLMRERAFLPQYLPFSSPGILPSIFPPQPATSTSFTTTDWLNSTKSPHKVPNITLDPSDQHKRAEDFALMKHRLREDALRRRQNVGRVPAGHLWKQQKSAIPVKNEVAEAPFVSNPHHNINNHVKDTEFLSKSPLHPRTVQTGEDPFVKKRSYDDSPLFIPNSNHSDISRRYKDQNFCPRVQHHKNVDSSTLWHPAKSSSEVHEQRDDEENEFVDVTGDGEHPTGKISPSHSQNIPSLSVSLASQQKSLEKISSNPGSSSPCASPKNVNFNSRNNSPPSFPVVTPTDNSRSHFKWDFPSASYIISSSGSHELRRLQSSLEESCDGKRKSEVLHDLVKIKWSSEERLSMKNKTLNDLKSELSRVRILREKEKEEFQLAKKHLQNEMERMRNDFHSRLRDATDSIADLGKKMAGEDDLHHQKILDELRKHADNQEEVSRALEHDLLQERERRMQAEKRLKEIVEESRGRIFSFMAGSNILSSAHPLPKVIPNSSGDEERLTPSGRKATSPFHHRKIEEQQSEDEAIDVEENIPTSRSCSSPTHSSKDSGVHDV